VTVELYGGAVVLRLEGELRRVHIRRFDHVTFPTEGRSTARLNAAVERGRVAEVSRTNRVSRRAVARRATVKMPHLFS
jgi:hypothetical protein